MRCNCCTSAGFFRHAAFPFKLERFRGDNDRAAEGLIFRSFREIIADADILYMTRVQRERFTDLMEYERVKNVYILRNKMLENTRPNLRILHPLPRVNEIAYDVDDNPKAYYFQQAQNGLYAREAILCDVLGITLDDVKNDILL